MQQTATPQGFVNQLWQFYVQNGRHDMAWRADTRPYYIVVSELMLQQTQVERVKQKFAEFTKRFPDWQSLADAQQSEVISLWQGLGYNRRALYLHKTAQIIVGQKSDTLPATEDELQQFPGIGPNTAGAILAFAFDEPVVFIETNIRRVLIHSFFPTAEGVEDAKILPILDEIIHILPQTEFTPRSFYWAMMDYGTYLKQEVPNPNRRSKHYSKQSQFEGSDRQLRGKILRVLLQKSLSENELQKTIEETNTDRFNMIVAALKKDGFITQKGNKITLQ